jgi:hypothetical protein
MKAKLPVLLHRPGVCSLLLIMMALLVAGCSNPSQSASQKSLHLPTLSPGASCPTTHGQKVSPDFGLALGNGPVYPVGFDANGVLEYSDAGRFLEGNNSDWGSQKVLWIIRPDYKGDAVIRGHQIDGPHGLLFGNGLDNGSLLTELELSGNAGGSPWANTPSYTCLQAPGCYAYQVDGDHFSYSLVFQALLIK